MAVAWWHPVVPVHSVLPFPIPPFPLQCRRSTHHPPYKQLLARLEVRSASSVIRGVFVVVLPPWSLVVVVVVAASLSPFCPYPPHKQVLARLGGRWWSFRHGVVVVISLPLCLPPVEVVVPPLIHPLSRCSWGWGRVVCRSSPWVVVVGRHLFGGLDWVGQCDVACFWGSLGAYLVGIPLLGCPGIALCAPDPSRHPHILSKWGGGDWAAVGMRGSCRVDVRHYH
jgi:hypothetical protein